MLLHGTYCFRIVAEIKYDDDDDDNVHYCSTGQTWEDVSRCTEMDTL